MKLKNILLSGLSLVLVAALAIGGTIAYLQDSDSDVNVMTLGNVKIEQHEYERAIDADGNYKTITVTKADGSTQESYELTEFKQAKPLLPGVGAVTNYDPTYVRFEQLGDPAKVQGGQAPLYGMNNVQDKFVLVENTGKTDAYVRTIIAFEAGAKTYAEWDAVIRTSTGDDGEPWEYNWLSETVNIEGNNYVICEAIYTGYSYGNMRHNGGILPAGEWTYSNLAQVYMMPTATNEDCEALDGNGNGTYDILVLSQAVQVAGFENAQTALDTAFGKSADKVAEWFGGMGKVQFVGAADKGDQLVGEDAEQVLNALQAGNDLIVDKNMDLVGFDTNEVNAQGATVTLAGQGAGAYGYLAFLPEAGEDVVLSNLNVTGSGFVEIGHYGMGGGEYTVNNLTVENLASTLANNDKGFTLACAFCHYGDAVLNNCVMTGATAITDGAIAVDAGFVNDTTTVVNGGEYGTIYAWSHAVVTLDGAKVDTLYTAPIKGTVTIKAGTSIDTLNIAYGTSAASAARLAKLTIEDGATIGKIVFSDVNNAAVTFSTVAEWNAYVAANFN